MEAYYKTIALSVGLTLYFGASAIATLKSVRDTIKEQGYLTVNDVGAFLMMLLFSPVLLALICLDSLSEVKVYQRKPSKDKPAK